MSTDNSEWSLDGVTSDTTDIPIDAEGSIEYIFDRANEQLEKISRQGKQSPESIELAKDKLRIMELTERLELATVIIDQQKATIARLKGDN